MVYQGSGGPPPSAVRAGRAAGNLGQKPFGFHFYEVLPNGKRKKASRFRISPGEKDVPFLFLDDARLSSEHHPSVRTHEFKFNGTFGNIVICNSDRGGGCLMDKALEREHKCFPSCKQPCLRIGNRENARGTWKWVATGIKMKAFTYTRGPLTGKTVQYQRCLLLVPDKQYEMFIAFREQYDKIGGLRGKVFNVRRDNDQRSSKIGTYWLPAGELTDEEMLAKFESSAEDYGLPVEDYIRPFDYATVLKELTTDEMNNASQWVASELGVNLDGSSAPAVTVAAVPLSEGDAEPLPF